MGEIHGVVFVRARDDQTRARSVLPHHRMSPFANVVGGNAPLTSVERTDDGANDFDGGHAGSYSAHEPRSASGAVLPVGKGRRASAGYAAALAAARRWLSVDKPRFYSPGPRAW